ncbi:MAG: sialate O-acetylesterase [Lentisphaeria bacterium]|nr:sialate O-acetylesterase [Lentisphaeria bacterium]
MKPILKIITLIAVAASAATITGCAASPSLDSASSRQAALTAGKPLKIYILVGQSNMQGQAQETTLPYMALDPKTRPLLDKIVDENGKPRVHENISIAAFSQDGPWSGPYYDVEKHGALTVGYGSALQSDSLLGPEVAFGITMQEHDNQPILIIKTAWGGKSLCHDFRPPSAGLPPVNEKTEAQWKKDGTYEAQMAAYKERVGRFYRLMMKHVNTVLADPGKYSKAYDPEQGCEIAGFVWFQGFNDKVNDYYSVGGNRHNREYGPYSDLLAHFIRDVRKDLDAPKMPFVIGVMGIGGKPEEDDPFRKAMAAPAEMEECKGNVIAVRTANYWDDALVEAAGKVSKLWDMKNNAYTLTREGDIDPKSIAAPGWQSVGNPPPEKRVWRYVTFDIDEDKQYRNLLKGEEGDVRFFNEDMPAPYADWRRPDFADSAWPSGPAPIGKGDLKVKIPEEHSAWGEGNMLLMRTNFELNPADYEVFRIVIMANQSYNVYLNGHKVATYVWWKKGGSYRAFELTKEQAAFLRNGTNVLAVQANISPKDPAANWVNAMLEGMSADDYAKLIKLYDSVCTPEDIETAKGKSNQAYHYLGSAKIYSQIGEAFANALIELKNN